MRIVYESLFQCGPPTDGDWDAPTFLYAVGDIPTAFSEEGQGGAAVINEQGGLSWAAESTRPHDLYVHVADQAALNQRIDDLLPARSTVGRNPRSGTQVRRDHEVMAKPLLATVRAACAHAAVELRYPNDDDVVAVAALAV